jgi:hypothetical protein
MITSSNSLAASGMPNQVDLLHHFRHVGWSTFSLKPKGEGMPKMPSFHVFCGLDPIPPLKQRRLSGQLGGVQPGVATDFEDRISIETRKPATDQRL